MKILLLGSKGMLGSEFSKTLKSSKEDYMGLDIEDLDLTNEEKLYDEIGKIKPKYILNCAAYTDVDKAEFESEKAFILNGLIPKYLADVSININACLIHFSSDFIFNGKSRVPYAEDNEPNPINAYGKSKLEGDKNIIKSLQKYFIIRTAWLYGKNGKNFVDTIIALSKTKKILKIVDDQIGSPTYAKDLACAVLKLIETDKYGIYNITNQGQCSRFEWVKEIIKIYNIKIDLINAKSSEFKVPSLRPSYSVLSNNKYNMLNLGIMRNWKIALKDYLIGS